MVSARDRASTADRRVVYEDRRDPPL
jgi:hypothetical protein